MKPKFLPSAQLSGPLATLILMIPSMHSAFAANRWWDGGSGNWSGGSTGLTKWSTVFNATTPDPGSAPGINDDLFFNITTANTAGNTLSFANGNRSAKSITFNTSGVSNFRGGGNSGVNVSLTLGGGGITLNSGAGAVDVGQTPSSFGIIRVVLNADQTWTNNSSNTLTVTGAISGAGRSLTKAGSGNIRLEGVSTYSGITELTGGTLTIGSAASIANTSAIILGASTTLNVSAVSGGFGLGAAQTLSGSGVVSGAISVAGTLSPGSSPGILSTGSQTWVNGGDYNFQMLDATGTAGTGSDQISVTGALDLTSLSAAGFSINLWSLAATGPDVDGDALNFNSSLNQSWTILTTTGGITGFDEADFTVNVSANNGTSGFSNALGGGSFSVSADANNLFLNFNAIPEPSVVLLGGMGCLMLLRRRR